MNEEKINNTQGTNNQTSTHYKTKDDSYKRQKLKAYEELDPNLKVMEYIYSKEKKSLNRNSVLRSFTYAIGFENLISLAKKTFEKTKTGDKIRTEAISFLDELTGGESLKDNKAIIIVPASFYPGNISIENAKQFLVDAQ
jgi:hypothetical protein